MTDHTTPTPPKSTPNLYGAPVFVLRAGGRLVVVGAPDAEESHHHHDHDPHPHSHGAAS